MQGGVGVRKEVWVGRGVLTNDAPALLLALMMSSPAETILWVVKQAQALLEGQLQVVLSEAVMWLVCPCSRVTWSMLLLLL
jgi:hypothetical protein